VARPMSLLRVRRRFWRQIAVGVSVEAAAGAAGVSLTAAKKWYRQAGGMSPISLAEPSGRYLSLAEREEIAVGIAAGHTDAQIARRLDRHRSTVGRERRRNAQRRHEQTAGRRAGCYRAVLAQAKAEARARRPKPAKLGGHTPGSARLREWVQAGLNQRWSPEQISRRARTEFADEPEMWVSHETIYQSIYVQGRGALRRELAACLRTGRAIRRPRRRAAARRSRARIPDMVNISERPAEAADRAVPGHWEGDLIIGKDGASAIGTLVERTTRYTMLLHLPDRHGAEAVRDAILAVLPTLPAHLRRSLTWDQGMEMAEHRTLSDRLNAQLTDQLDGRLDPKLEVFFCDPHSPWQRGTNENTNGLLRQYFPKGTDLSTHTAEHLAAVAAELNGRPRKTLDWATPAEALTAALASPPEPDQPTGVATTA